MKMTAKQKSIMLAINVYVFAFLMHFITRVVTAYIGLDYPEQSDMAIRNLNTFPALFGIAAALLVGPVALRVSKVWLAAITLFFEVVCSAIFYLTGLLHLPFAMLYVACFFAGFAQGAYIPLLNSIISDHFPAEQRGNCIARYNVWINIGAVFITYAAGWLAVSGGADGSRWYNAYLLGVAPVIGMVIFLILAKKADADTPSIVSQTPSGEAKAKPKISDIPGRVLLWVVLMGVVHGLFYVTQTAFNVNVSNYIVTEYSLGTAVQAGTATSLVRFALIPFTALYPVFKRVLKEWMIPVGYLSMAAGLAIMMLSKSLFGAYACAIFCGLSTALVHSSFYAKASRYVPIALVPISMSIVSCLVNTGNGFANYVLEFFANMMGGGMANRFLTGIIVSVVIAVAATFMYVIRKPVEQVD